VKAQLAYPLNTREPTEREAMRQLAVREIGAAVSSPIGSCLLAYAVSDYVDSQRLEGWLISQVFFAFCSLLLSLWLLKRLGSSAARNAVARLMVVTLALEGLTWGIAPLLLVTPDPAYNVLTLAGVCIAASLTLHTLCLYRPAMVIFLLCLLLPSSVANLLAGNRFDLILGLGTLAVLGLSLFYGFVSGRLAREGINATVQSAMLADQLKSNNADLRTALRAIRQMATRDPLTQSYNRRALLEFLEREMVAQDRGGQSLGILMIDVDHFKLVNDNFGHLTGDDVLKALCHRLDNLMRGNDFLARYGGEEFVCIIHVNDEQQLLAAGERIRAAVADKPILSKPEPLSVQVSIGCALRRRGEEGNALFARSDKALYKAKNAGRNQVVLDAMTSSPLAADLNISSEL
jgi:diguanylate cyclase (GGDEF)-like protein